MRDPSVDGPAQADDPSIETRTESDGTLVIRPHGELDADVFRHLLVHAVRKVRPRQLVINLGDVHTLDAIHVGALLALCDLAEDCQVPIVLANPSVQVRSDLLAGGASPERIRYTRDTVTVETPEVASMS